jgi:hypothetical protein
MKNLLKMWSLFVILFSVFCLSMAYGMASADTNQIVNVSTLPDPVSQTRPVWDWIQTNWAVIALIASETAALLPTKINGIVQGVIRGLTAFFNPKKSS